MKWELLTPSEITLPKKHKDDKKIRGLITWYLWRQNDKASGRMKVLGDERTDCRVVKG
jgi:hypothetical protein